MNMEKQLQQLLDKKAIEEVIKKYARALDRMDRRLLRSVFHPGSKHAHFYEGPSSDPKARAKPGDHADFVDFALDLLKTHSRTHHQLGNTLIEMKSDTEAFAETYFTAFHRMRAIGDKLAAENAYDTEMDYFVGGRYIDRFEKRDGKWKITHRTGMTDWMRLEPPSSQAFASVDPAQISQRGKQDMVYTCRKLYS